MKENKETDDTQEAENMEDEEELEQNEEMEACEDSEEQEVTDGAEATEETEVAEENGETETKDTEENGEADLEEVQAQKPEMEIEPTEQEWPFSLFPLTPAPTRDDDHETPPLSINYLVVKSLCLKVLLMLFHSTYHLQKHLPCFWYFICFCVVQWSVRAHPDHCFKDTNKDIYVH